MVERNKLCSSIIYGCTTNNLALSPYNIIIHNNSMTVVCIRVDTSSLMLYSTE